MEEAIGKISEQTAQANVEDCESQDVGAVSSPKLDQQIIDIRRGLGSGH